MRLKHSKHQYINQNTPTTPQYILFGFQSFRNKTKHIHFRKIQDQKIQCCMLIVIALLIFLRVITL